MSDEKEKEELKYTNMFLLSIIEKKDDQIEEVLKICSQYSERYQKTLRMVFKTFLIFAVTLVLFLGMFLFYESQYENYYLDSGSGTITHTNVGSNNTIGDTEDGSN